MNAFGVTGTSHLYGYADVDNNGVFTAGDPSFAVDDGSATTITVPLDTSNLGPQVDLLQIYSNGGNQIVPIDYTVVPVPEPVSALLLLTGATLFSGRRFHRKR